MSRGTTFTTHAFQRVDERLHMSPKEIARLLDSGQYTPVGFALRSSKKHLLFYSPEDNECFVAVRDEKNLEVVTILPYHYDCHCRISPEAVGHLKALYEQNGHTDYTPDPTFARQKSSIASPQIECTYIFFEVKLRRNTLPSKHIKPRVRVPIEQFPGDPEHLSKSPAVHQKVYEIVQEGFKKYSLVSASFSFGKYGRKHPIDLPKK